MWILRVKWAMRFVSPTPWIFCFPGSGSLAQIKGQGVNDTGHSVDKEWALEDMDSPVLCKQTPVRKLE